MRLSIYRRSFVRLVALAIPLVTCVASAADRQRAGLAVPIAGEPFKAGLIKIDSDWNLTLDQEGRQRNVAVADLVRWGAYREDDAAARVVLRDGSILVADVMELDETSLTLESAFWPATRIARACSAGIVFAPPATTQARDRLLDKIRTQKQAKDTVALRNGDQIAGRLTPIADSAEARDAFGLRAFGLAVRTDREPLAVAVDDTMAILLSAAAAGTSIRPSGPVMWLGFQDGSLLSVDSIAVRSQKIHLTLSCGQRIVLSAEAIYSDVCLVQPMGFATRYLSDLTPLGYQHSPFLELKRPLGRDRNVLGGQLRTAGDLYLKGLGMPTTSRVVYQVTEADRQFAAELALDDEATDRGSVVYRIFQEKPQGQQEAVWQATYTSPVVRGGDAPLPISLDLSGTARIALIVDFSDHGDARDYANWLNARFLP